MPPTGACALRGMGPPYCTEACRARKTRMSPSLSHGGVALVRSIRMLRPVTSLDDLQQEPRCVFVAIDPEHTHTDALKRCCLHFLEEVAKEGTFVVLASGQGLPPGQDREVSGFRAFQ